MPELYDTIGRTYATTRRAASYEPIIAELRRVTRQRLVFLTWRAEITNQMWLLRDYSPAAAAQDAQIAVSVDALVELLGGAEGRSRTHSPRMRRRVRCRLLAPARGLP